MGSRLALPVAMPLEGAVLAPAAAMSGRGAPLPREGSPTRLCPLTGSRGDPRRTPDGPGEPAVTGWVPPRGPRLTLLLPSGYAG